ncbi:MAG: type II toxin-antitoxin system VapC family toxin [Burkholderiales bacterium]
MNVTVVDASAVAAVLFDEAEAEPVLASLSGPLTAPNLLVYELASVCSTKLARYPAQAQTILARYLLFGQLDIELTEPEWETLPRLALEWTLSAYDAAYLQLALMHRAPLVTLDARLSRAYDKASA